MTRAYYNEIDPFAVAVLREQIASGVIAPGDNGFGLTLGNRMLLDATALSGPITNGSSAPSTAKRGAPNPLFPFWLMGFPTEWVSGALRAAQSFRKSRRKF